MSQAKPGLISAGRVASGGASKILFEPKPFGPEFVQPTPDTLVIRSGNLFGQTFHLEIEISGHEAHIRLSQDDAFVGRIDFELGTRLAKIVLWDALVRTDLRGNGLAALMTRIALRRLYQEFGSASTGIRMIKLLDPGHNLLQVQNTGMGVIAHQLGFSFVTDLAWTLRPANIEKVELILTENGTPPAYRILLRSYPLMLVALMTALDTGLPLPSRHPIYSESVTPAAVERWATDPSIIFGNGDYVLRRPGVIQLVNHIADSPEEAAWLITRIKPVN